MTILAAIILVIQDRRLTRDELFGALGLNLMSSAVFGIIFASLSSRVQESKLEADLEERFEELSKRIAGHIADSNKKFLPASVYVPSDGFDPVFNRFAFAPSTPAKKRSWLDTQPIGDCDQA